MINIGALTEMNKGQKVWYKDSSGKIEEGIIKSWNDKFVFVVYPGTNEDKRNNWWNYTAAATRPEDLHWELFSEIAGQEMKLQNVLDIGDSVICDNCGQDLTNDDIPGGFIFGSRAVCPYCSERMMNSIKKYNEENYIKAYCPEGLSYREWVLKLRNGDNAIKFYVGKE